jgi:hypothetical protein
MSKIQVAKKLRAHVNELSMEAPRDDWTTYEETCSETSDTL